MGHIVGLIGAKGCGKDTFAKVLSSRFGYVRLAFADALYGEAAAAFNVTVDFLGNRDTKETPLPELALVRCKDPHFLIAVLNEKPADMSGYDWLHLPRSPRWILQKWGTEYKRRSQFGYDSYWLDQIRDAILANPSGNFVITDVRFSNEANFVALLEGTLVRIRRPLLEQQEAEERANNGTAAHPSETELLNWQVQRTVINEEGNLHRLDQEAEALLGICT
jgi:hypothetical protein